jgi:hypothetical protein
MASYPKHGFAGYRQCIEVNMIICVVFDIDVVLLYSERSRWPHIDVP